MKKYCTKCIYESLPHEKVNFLPQESIFLEGDFLNYVYRIVNGYVKISRIHSSGDEKIFDVLGPGDYIALLAVLQGKNEYVASATAINRVEAIRIKNTEVLKAFQSSEIFKNSCLNCAVTRTILFQNKLFQASNIDTEDKILNALRLLSNRFGSCKDNYVEMKLPFTKTELANIIGIRRETLSRKLSEMRNKNILQIERNIYKFNRL